MDFKVGKTYKAKVRKVQPDDYGVELYEDKVFDFSCVIVNTDYSEDDLSFVVFEDPYRIKDDCKLEWYFTEEQLDFEYYKKEIRFEIVKDEFRKNKDTEILLPRRATKGSAGYDFYLPYDVTIEPKQEVMIWSDIKIKMPEDMVFEMVMRSSYGIKKSLMMKNLIPKIDSDYYQNFSNDGNTGLCIYNYGDVKQELKKGDAFCQGTFFKYYITDDDCPVSEIRTGGIGSTSK